VGIPERLKRLEDRAFPEHADCLYRDRDQMEAYIQELEARGWPVEEQIDDVIASWRIHRLGGTKQLATDRELYVAGELARADVGVLPPDARDYFERMEPAKQPEREAWLFDRRELHARHRELDAAIRAFREEHGISVPLPEHICAMIRELYGA
jgi:hypothetical protein